MNSIQGILFQNRQLRTNGIDVFEMILTPESAKSTKVQSWHDESIARSAAEHIAREPGTKRPDLGVWSSRTSDQGSSPSFSDFTGTTPSPSTRIGDVDVKVSTIGSTKPTQRYLTGKATFSGQTISAGSKKFALPIVPCSIVCDLWDSDILDSPIANFQGKEGTVPKSSTLDTLESDEMKVYPIFPTN
jgi:hypothetical protein